MSTATALADLTLQVTNTLDVFTTQQTTVAGLISTAVTVSENAAQIPLVTIATNMVDTHTLLLSLIDGHT